MNDGNREAVTQIQALIDADADPEQAPPFVRGMDLSGVVFKSVEVGHFVMEWTIDAHLTHFDGIVQGGVVNVVADTGQSFAFWSTSTGPEMYSTYEFTTRFLRPMKTGDVLEVSSEVVNRSRRVGVIETRFVNRDTGKLCAMVTGSWMLTDRELSG